MWEGMVSLGDRGREDRIVSLSDLAIINSPLLEYMTDQRHNLLSMLWVSVQRSLNVGMRDLVFLSLHITFNVV